MSERFEIEVKNGRPSQVKDVMLSHLDIESKIIFFDETSLWWNRWIDGTAEDDLNKLREIEFPKGLHGVVYLNDEGKMTF